MLVMGAAMTIERLWIAIKPLIVPVLLLVAVFAAAYFLTGDDVPRLHWRL